MRTRPLKHRMRGVAAVEFAILLFPLVVLTFGMTEIGRAVYYYNTLLKSSRDAARYLSMMPQGAAEATAARCLAAYGVVDCAGRTEEDALVPGLRPVPEMIAVNYQTGVSTGTGTGAVDLVTVTITGFQFRSLVPLSVRDMVFRQISCTMRQGTS